MIFCLLSFMLPTTSEISWTRSGPAYFIVPRKRGNAHAYERVRAALKWNQAQYTWPNRRFLWKYVIVNTWQPTGPFPWLWPVASKFESQKRQFTRITDWSTRFSVLKITVILLRPAKIYPAMIPVLGICCPQNCDLPLPPPLSAPFASGAAKTNKPSNLSVNSLPMQWSAIMSPVPSD